MHESGVRVSEREREQWRSGTARLHDNCALFVQRQQIGIGVWREPERESEREKRENGKQRKENQVM